MSGLESPNALPLATSGRRKRPHVPESSRKRVARACDTCRKVKEKCEGGNPCSRCTRLHRSCRNNTTERQQASTNQPTGVAPDFFDADRIRALETIVRHYNRIPHFDKAYLLRVAHALPSPWTSSAAEQSDHALTSQSSIPDAEEEFEVGQDASSTSLYTGSLSHCQFSSQLRQKLDQGVLGATSKENSVSRSRSETNRANRLRSEPSIVTAAIATLPPPEIANFLIDIFFDFGQTNYFYADESSIVQQYESYYLSTEQVHSSDAPSVCLLLMVFAMGAQFAHLSVRVGPNSASPMTSITSNIADDEIALTYYRTAATLVVDLIAIASVESVQALVLLATFALPIDADGVSYTYLGSAIRLAIQNGMHRKYYPGMDSRGIELRNRVWWTVYTLDRRICALHGRPISMSDHEVDTVMPKKTSAFGPATRLDTLPNVMAMIRVTAFLDEARTTLLACRKDRGPSNPTDLAPVTQLASDLESYWQSLPNKLYCRDVSTNGPLFRSNVHLALTYHLIRVFIGRAFVFLPATSTGPPTPESVISDPTRPIQTLVSSCIESAVTIVDLCQTLHDNSGLARASYTEFTSCRAALMAILAQRISDRCTRLQKVTERGMELLKHMSLGFYEAGLEKAALGRMQRAVKRLDTDHDKLNGTHTSTSGDREHAYDHFRSWATLWTSQSPQDLASGHGQQLTDGSKASAYFDFDFNESVNPSLFEDYGWNLAFPGYDLGARGFPGFDDSIGQ